MYQRDWAKKHREEAIERNRVWREENPERAKQISHDWREKNKERLDIYHKNWIKNNPEKVKCITKRCSKNNPNIQKRKNAKRRRNLGFNPLNTKFPGSVGHHINRNDVIYIPEELHKSVIHKQEDIRSMNEINKLVTDWYNKQGELSLCP